MPCCYARQRLLQERRVGVRADPHLSNGGLAGLAARRSHANSGQVLDAVHFPIRGVERVVRVGNDAQALGVRRLGNRAEDLATPVLVEGVDEYRLGKRLRACARKSHGRYRSKRLQRRSLSPCYRTHYFVLLGSGFPRSHIVATPSSATLCWQL